MRIGSNSVLVAPVNVGDGAYTGAGSVVTKDVPTGALVKGVPAQVDDQWAERWAERRAEAARQTDALSDTDAAHDDRVKDTD